MYGSDQKTPTRVPDAPRRLFGEMDWVTEIPEVSNAVSSELCVFEFNGRGICLKRMFFAVAGRLP
jgi:hypothetical protein